MTARAFRRAVAVLLGAVVAAPPPAAAVEDDLEHVARDACDDCHAFPPPDTRPRREWRKIVYEMAGLAMSRIGAPADAELRFDFDVERLLHFFEQRAPESLPPSEAWPAPRPEAAPRFERHSFSPEGGGAEPSVSNVQFVDLDADGRLEIVAADMGAGLVLTADPRRPEGGLVELLSAVPHPAHFEAVDLDCDGTRDLLVADLGSYGPGDHEQASVVWLQRLAGGGRRVHTLARGLPRAADAQAADFDGDGDLDVVVAAFGWRAVGEVILLENRTEDWSSPRFERARIDPRSGAIHVPVADLNGDARPDFVALLSQHHEKVSAFLNTGAGFVEREIYAAPHPGWGSSGIQLADLDADGDLDVLLTHGDMLDDFLLKPWHGIQWLENRGEYPFVARDLAPMNGVHRAQAGDLDGDGDLDVVAGAFVQTGMAGQRDLRSGLPSLVWLEQTAPGEFARHTLETGGQHATLDLADYDEDGDLDLVVGNFRQHNTVWVELWENRGSEGE